LALKEFQLARPQADSSVMFFEKISSGSAIRVSQSVGESGAFARYAQGRPPIGAWVRRYNTNRQGLRSRRRIRVWFEWFGSVAFGGASDSDAENGTQCSVDE